MKDKKILFLILFALLLLFLILYLSRSVNIETARLKKTAEPLRSNALRLESQVGQLQDLLQGFVQLNITMKNNLDGEKKQNSELKKMLEDVSRQKETLTGELSQAGDNLELTKGIRKTLSEMEKSLAAVKLEPGREKEFKNKLWELNRGLDKINYQIPDLIRENKNYKRESQDLKEALDKKEKDIYSLKAGSREAKDRLQELDQNIRGLSREIKSLKDANGSLEAKAADMEKLQNELKQTNSGLNSELDRIKKDLETSREKLCRSLKEAETLQKQKKSYVERIRGLEASEAEIAPLKKQIEELKQEKSALGKDLEAIKARQLSAQKIQEELTKLQSQFSQLSADHETLKGKAQANEETLKQNTIELGKRADRILTMSDQLSSLEAKTGEAGLKSQELEKVSALLRQENVSLRLEKESLNGQLAQAKLKLNELENQALQINSILNAASGRQVKPPEPENKRIEVEVNQETANESK